MTLLAQRPRKFKPLPQVATDRCLRQECPLGKARNAKTAAPLSTRSTVYPHIPLKLRLQPKTPWAWRPLVPRCCCHHPTSSPHIVTHTDRRPPATSDTLPPSLAGSPSAVTTERPRSANTGVRQDGSVRSWGRPGRVGQGTEEDLLSKRQNSKEHICVGSWPGGACLAQLNTGRRCTRCRVHACVSSVCISRY